MHNSKQHSKNSGHKRQSAEPAAESLVGQVTGKISDVVGVVREVPGQAVEYVRDQYDHVNERAHEIYDEARDTAVEYYSDFEDAVTARPVRSVLIAGGIGFLVGMIMARR